MVNDLTEDFFDTTFLTTPVDDIENNDFDFFRDGLNIQMIIIGFYINK